MVPYQPSPPEGAGNPFDWGREEYVAELLGDAFAVDFSVLDSPYEPDSGEEAWELFSTSYGPTKTLADSLSTERREALHQAIAGYFESLINGRLRQSRAYLLITGTRR